MLFAPPEGWRQVTERRTSFDYAHNLRDLVDKHFLKAAQIVLLKDNLNTQPPAVLHEALEPAKARHIDGRFEWSYRPKYASWLNLADPKLALLSNQCLSRRIADRRSRKIRAGQASRNNHNAKASWQFITTDAGVKLNNPYLGTLIDFTPLERNPLAISMWGI